jgi:hypothetical protein
MDLLIEVLKDEETEFRWDYYNRKHNKITNYLSEDIMLNIVFSKNELNEISDDIKLNTSYPELYKKGIRIEKLVKEEYKEIYSELEDNYYKTVEKFMDDLDKVDEKMEELREEFGKKWKTEFCNPFKGLKNYNQKMINDKKRNMDFFDLYPMPELEPKCYEEKEIIEIKLVFNIKDELYTVLNEFICFEIIF